MQRPWDEPTSRNAYEAEKEGDSGRKEGRRQPGATSRCRVSSGKGHISPTWGWGGEPHKEVAFEMRLKGCQQFA